MNSSGKTEGDALAEGRRIYIGNLAYNLRPTDIEEALTANDFANYENIHISIDPISARNPGYCFVDFADRETAGRALSSLKVTIRGRDIKVGPCEPKKQRDGYDRPTFQRWGNWKGSSDDNADRPDAGSSYQRPDRGGQGPKGALDHFEDMVKNFGGKRLYVGGLPKMIDQDQNRQEVEGIFAGFNPAAIGKRITPHASTRARVGNHHYCFVDFETKEEAQNAIEALNGKPHLDGILKVSIAKDIPENLANPSTNNDRGQRSRRPLNPESEGQAGSNRAMASNNWRRKDTSE